MVNKSWCLATAIEITKEYSRGGGELSPANVLASVYLKLKELEVDANA